MQKTSRLVRPLRSGQITIPAEFRKRLQIDEQTLLEISLIDGELRVRPVKVASASRAGSGWARELYEMFAPVREEAAPAGEKQINADIDRAIAAARGKRDSRRH